MSPWSPWLSWSCLLAIHVVACRCDWSRRRIPNPLVLAAGGSGLMLQAVLAPGAGLFAPGASAGAVGWPAAMGAVALTATIGFVLWRLHVFGAGDAKLLAAVAAFAGPQGVPTLLLATFICGGALALGVLAAQRRRGWPAAAGPVLAAPLRLPYSLAIAAGSLIQAAGASAGLSLP